MKNKHLTLNDRIYIEKSLDTNKSFKEIAKYLEKDCSSISKEIRKNLTQKNSGAYGRKFNNCANRFSCNLSAICDNCFQAPGKLCKNCPSCRTNCSNFKEDKCKKLSIAPYVCNACPDFRRCTLSKQIYDAANAQKNYNNRLVDSRTGIVINQNEIDNLNSILSDLIINKHQSIHNAYINNLDKIMYSEKTIYKIIDSGLLKVRNIDLPRKVRFRLRRKINKIYKVDKSCLENRRYEDFLNYMKENPDTNIVEMDSVEGIKGSKVLLTIHFVNCSFMLAFIRDHNDSESVIKIFNNLYELLGHDTFKRLFPIILTDNGSEFSNPKAIEFDSENQKRTKIFYCHPSSPFEKGACEVNHELLRRVLSKGSSFDNISQEQVNIIMSNINSYARKKLNDKSPISSFNLLYNKDIIKLLGIHKVSPNEINLSPSLLKK